MAYNLTEFIYYEFWGPQIYWKMRICKADKEYQNILQFQTYVNVLRPIYGKKLLTRQGFSSLSLLFSGTIGLIGNVLSIVILSKPDMYNSFNQLLIGLSTMDSIFIVLAILDYSFAR